MQHTEKITFRASTELKNEIVRLAQMQGVSSGQLIRKWIEVFTSNQIIDSTKHYYRHIDGRQFSNMKMACEQLKLSSHAFRKLVKNNIIEKVNIEQHQAIEHGNEISTTSSRTSEENRVQI